ncbi:hypothetical protein DFH09DRAFT_198037 [Mycena vulgaris]|nr:hypothetical protein DFH09DRAFT_198037 [Mycena vulgaris]
MFSVQRSFSIDAAVLAPGHPYAVKPSPSASTIHFFEFRGIGPPSTGFGHAGDVYIDIDPRLRALYWRERGSGAGRWRRWTALLLNKVPLHGYLVSHPWVRSPEASDLHLWADPDGVTWNSMDGICASRAQMIQHNIATVAPRSTPDVEALVSEVLSRMLEQEKTDQYSSHGRSQTTSPPTLHRIWQKPLHEQIPRANSSSQSFHHISALPGPAGLLAIEPQRSGNRNTQTTSELFRPSRHHASSPHASYSGFVPSMQRIPLTGNEEAIRSAEIALEKMRQAQDAEIRSKRKLRQVKRELTQCR